GRDRQRLNSAAAEPGDRDLLGIDAAVVRAVGALVLRERPVDRGRELRGARRRIGLDARALGTRRRVGLAGTVVYAARRDRDVTVRRHVQQMQPRARAVVRAAAVAEHVDAELRVAEALEIGRAVHDLIRQAGIDLLERSERAGAGRIRKRVAILWR